MSLTSGSIAAAQGGNTPPEPVLQVLNVKPLNASDGGNRRFRLIVSDGVHYQQAMLATQMNGMVDAGEVKQYTVVRLKEYIVNAVANKKIIIMLQIEVVSQPTDKIGDPKNVDILAAAPAAPAAAAAPAPAAPPAAAAAPASSAYGLGRAMAAGHASAYGGGGGGGGVGSAAGRPTMPISALNPYAKGWFIKGRVTRRGDIREYNNARGPGKLFNFDVLDAAGSEIRVCAFNQDVDKYFPVVELGKVYVIGNCQLKMANKKWNNTNTDYELTLNSNSVVEFVGEDAAIATQNFDFVKLDRLEQLETNANVDVLAVVVAVGPLAEIVSQKQNKEIKKRTVTLMDQSGVTVDFTMWRDMAEENTEKVLAGNPVVAIKSARVSDFGGVSLNSGFGSPFIIEPDRPDAHALRGWYDSQGSSVQPRALSSGRGGARGPLERAVLAASKEPGFTAAADGGNARAFEQRATITFFKHDPERAPWYMSCPDDNCKKKMPDTGMGPDSAVMCEKCGAEGVPKPRYILPVLINDWTDQSWATAFNTEAVALLGRPAEELKAMLDGNRIEEFEAVFKAANFKSYVFRLRARMETHEDEQRLKTTINGIAPVNFVEESRRMLQEINSYA